MPSDTLKNNYIDLLYLGSVLIAELYKALPLTAGSLSPVPESQPGYVRKLTVTSG